VSLRTRIKKPIIFNWLLLKGAASAYQPRLVLKLFSSSCRSAEPLYPARFGISTSCAKQASEKAIPSSRLAIFIFKFYAMFAFNKPCLFV